MQAQQHQVNETNCTCMLCAQFERQIDPLKHLYCIRTPRVHANIDAHRRSTHIHRPTRQTDMSHEHTKITQKTITHQPHIKTTSCGPQAASRRRPRAGQWQPQRRSDGRLAIVPSAIPYILQHIGSSYILNRFVLIS